MGGNGKRELTKAQLEALARGRQIGARLGGLAVKDKRPPDTCPDCGREIATAGYTWHQWLGHRGLHGLADKWFDSDLALAQQWLRENGLARQDPFPENGAFRPYIPVAEALPTPEGWMAASLSLSEPIEREVTR